MSANSQGGAAALEKAWPTSAASSASIMLRLLLAIIGVASVMSFGVNVSPQMTAVNARCSPHTPSMMAVSEQEGERARLVKQAEAKRAAYEASVKKEQKNKDLTVTDMRFASTTQPSWKTSPYNLPATVVVPSPTVKRSAKSFVAKPKPVGRIVAKPKPPPKPLSEKAAAAAAAKAVAKAQRDASAFRAKAEREKNVAAAKVAAEAKARVIQFERERKLIAAKQSAEMKKRQQEFKAKQAKEEIAKRCEKLNALPSLPHALLTASL